MICNGADVLLKGWDEVQTELGDKVSFLSSLRDSPYFAPFQDQAVQMLGLVQVVESIIVKLSGIQRRWVYLAPIFKRGARPKEQTRFQRINQEFHSVMDTSQSNEVEPAALEVSTRLGQTELSSDKLASLLSRLYHLRRSEPQKQNNHSSVLLLLL